MECRVCGTKLTKINYKINSIEKSMTLEEFNALPNRMFITKCPICHSPQTIKFMEDKFSAFSNCTECNALILINFDEKQNIIKTSSKEQGNIWRKVDYCPRCFSKIELASKYCHNCGLDFLKIKICNRCFSPNYLDEKLCHACGADFSIKPNITNVCTNCKEDNLEIAVMCANCDQNLLMIHCSNCYEDNEFYWTSCYNCGAQIGKWVLEKDELKKTFDIYWGPNAVDFKRALDYEEEILDREKPLILTQEEQEFLDDLKFAHPNIDIFQAKALYDLKQSAGIINSFSTIGTDVTDLVIHQEQLTELPITFQYLDKLWNIDLSFCKLTTLPNYLKNFRALENLKIIGNPFDSFPPVLNILHEKGVIIDAYDILKDEFGSKTVTTPPVIDSEAENQKIEIEQKEDLKEKDTIQITRTRDSKEAFNYYKKMGLNAKEVLGLVNLEYIAGDLPLVDEISPETFGVMIENKKVVGLGLYNRKIEEFPDDIIKFKDLVSLSLSGNNIESWPENFGSLKKLENLFLDNNYMEIIPDFFQNFKKLKRLSIASSNLLEIPTWLGNFSNLTFLNLANNDLDIFPKALEKLKKLKKFILTGNDFDSIPDYLEKWAKNVEILL